MSNHFSNLLRVVLDFFLRRTPQDNPMAKCEIPGFLRQPSLPAEPGKMTAGIPRLADDVAGTKSVAAFILDGERVVYLGTRMVPARPIDSDSLPPEP